MEPAAENAPTGASDSYPFLDEIRIALSYYEQAPDGNGIVVGPGILIPLDEIIEWHKKFKVDDNRFFHWCKSNALVINDMEETEKYFGQSSILLDFDAQRAIWPHYLESRIDEKLSGEPGAATLLDVQIVFEASYGLSSIGNAYLFPSRKYLIDAFGGFDSEMATITTVRGKHARPAKGATKKNDAAASPVIVAMKLEDRYDREKESTTFLAEMVKRAVESYLAGTYDAVAIFEGYRDDIRRWANRVYFCDHECDEATKQAAVNRLAGKKMIQAEGVILNEIARRTSSSKSAPMRFDRDRMNKLREGSYYRP